jgi:hypothetical protein
MKPKPPAEAPTAQKTAPVSPGIDAQAAQSFDDGPCSDFEKRLQAFFLVDEKQVAAPDSCFPALKQRPLNSPTLQGQASHLRFVIATLPDPLHTYFPLIFDRTAEAIQQAGQDEGYVYDSSSLPWETAGTADDANAEKRRKTSRAFFFSERLSSKRLLTTSPSIKVWLCSSSEKSRRPASIAVNSKMLSSGSTHCNQAAMESNVPRCKSSAPVSPVPFPRWWNCFAPQLRCSLHTPNRNCVFSAATSAAMAPCGG